MQLVHFCTWNPHIGTPWGAAPPQKKLWWATYCFDPYDRHNLFGRYKDNIINNWVMGTYLMSSVIKYHTLDYMIICPGLGILAVVHLCTYIWAVYECHCPHRSKYITGTLALDMPLHTVSCGQWFFCQWQKSILGGIGTAWSVCPRHSCILSKWIRMTRSFGVV